MDRIWPPIKVRTLRAVQMRTLQSGYTLKVLLETVENLLYAKFPREVIMLQVFERVMKDFLNCVNDLAIHG